MDGEWCENEDDELTCEKRWQML